MYANYTSMQHNFASSAPSAEAAASFCAFLLLGSAILAESIFAIFSILPVIIVVVRLYIEPIRNR